MKIYCEGKIIPESECSISASDHGFLYGISLFETFRTFNKKPFLLEAHLRRMQTSCKAFSIALHDRLLSADPKGVNLQKILQQLLETNDLSDAVFRCTISSGQPSENPGDPFYPNPREFIFVRPLPPPPPDGGIDLHILQTTRKPPEVFPRPKSGNFADNVLALQELQRRKPTPSGEGLLLTADGRLSECIHSNLFIIRDDALFTPSPEAFLLEGITRKTVLDLAEKTAISAQENNLHIADLKKADAVFTTNSVRGLTPVARIFDEKGFLFWQNDSKKNPIFRRLTEAYLKLTF